MKFFCKNRKKTIHLQKKSKYDYQYAKSANKGRR